MGLAALIVLHLGALAAIALAAFRFGRERGLDAGYRAGYGSGRRDQIAIHEMAERVNAGLAQHYLREQGPSLRVVRNEGEG